MRLNNPWVGYLTRTYQTIKESILNRMRTALPEVTDLNESNIFVILASLFAGMTEQLNYYLDNNARESYLSTARQYSSVVKLVKILDYRIKARIPASVDLYFTYLNNDGSPSEITEPGIIPEATIVTTQNGVEFLTLESIEIPVGSSYGKVSGLQVIRVTNVDLGITTSLPYQEYVIPGEYANGSLEVMIDNTPWNIVKTLATALPTDKVFVVNIGEDRIPRVNFGNGINGAIPPPGYPVLANYYLTEGEAGNNVNRGMINVITTSLVLPNPSTQVKVRNELHPVGGAELESIESIRFNAPLVTKAVERAVTKEDYNSLAQQYDGVAKATVVHDCGPGVVVYIAPNGGGIANDLLLQGTKDYLDSVRLINTSLEVKSAGESPITIDLTVTPRYRVNVIDLTNEIIDALLTRFSLENMPINSRVAVSDIMAAVDNIDRVDIVEINKLSVLPYANPIEHTDPLDWEREIKPGSTTKIKWRLVYDGTKFRLFKNGYYLGLITPDTVYSDPDNIFNLKINSSGMYSVSQTWDFTTYPVDRTIQLDDNTVATFSQFTITVNIINSAV